MSDADLVIIIITGILSFAFLAFLWPIAAREEEEQRALERAKQAEIERLASQPNVPQDGHLFEQWVAQRLRNIGWKAEVTRGSGDQGIDVICVKDGYQFGIQCKRVSRPAGNKAVQEVISGGIFYGIPNLAVVSSAGYTDGAVDLANKANVTLLLPSELTVLDDLIQK